MTALQRLLKHPHSAVFDKEPGSELALRIRHPDGASWRVADEVLIVTAGALQRSYQLSQLTIGQLAAALADDGFEVPTLAADWAGRSAMVLVEGVGDQGESNGDHLTAFTSILWALLSGYADGVREAEYQVAQALRQMVITQAEGEWLDLWGMLYATPRLPGESDTDYSRRIPREAFRIRVNARAIELAIRDATGSDVRIEEPWKEIFTLDQSTLSGPDRLYNGLTHGYHLIRPVARTSVDWDAVLKVIDRNRAAGVLVVNAVVTRLSWVDASQGRGIMSILRRLHPAGARYQDRALLDFMKIEDTSVPNHPARHRRTIRRISGVVVPSLSWGDIPWIPVSWDAPSYVVRSSQMRSFRSYTSGSTYTSSYWSDQPSRTWSAEATWSDTTRIFAAHSSSS